VLIYLAAAALLLALLATILIIEALRMKNPPPAPLAAVPRGWGGRFGVNLGAVFVPEPGFAASLFAEMPRPSPWDGDWASVVQATGREAARARYLAHIDRYIDGPLLAELAAAGNTLLRVPLGFWNLLAFPGPGGLHGCLDPSTAPASQHVKHAAAAAAAAAHEAVWSLSSDAGADYLPRLERLLVRAEAAGFTAVLLDMHAPACSANGAGLIVLGLLPGEGIATAGAVASRHRPASPGIARDRPRSPEVARSCGQARSTAASRSRAARGYSSLAQRRATSRSARRRRWRRCSPRAPASRGAQSSC